MKKISKVFAVALLTFGPFFTFAQVAQIVFTTDEQSVETNEISGILTIQLQDSEGNLYQTDETIDIEFSSSSETGEFLSPASTTPVTTTMASSTANKNFRYRDSTEGTFVLSINATGRESHNTWSVSQTIVVADPVPDLPVINISSPIISDTAWSPGSVYLIDSSFSVASGTALIIEPGTIIKAKTTALGGPSIYGTLIAEGTSEQPIYFTSRLDDSVGGDSDGGGASAGEPGQWQGLYFKPGSVGKFDHVTVRYAGEGGFGFGNFVGVENDGGILDIKHSNIHDNYKIVSNGGGGSMSAGTGIISKNGTLSVSDSIVSNHVYGMQVVSGTTTISNTVFQNHTDSTGHNTGYGVHANGQGSLTLSDNTFSSNDRTAYVEAQIDFSHTGNTSSDVANRGFERGGLITGHVVFEVGGDMPTIVPNGNRIIVDIGGILTIEPGSIIKFGSSGQIIVEGKLISEGAETSKIYLTSLKDDSVGGDTNGDGGASSPNMTDWGGIVFQNGSVGEFSHSVIKYSGAFTGLGDGSGRAAIFNLGGDIFLENVSFTNNFLNDIYQNMGSTTISRSTFSTSTNPAIDNANASSTLDARLNWWGIDTGPTHQTNATGTGPSISDDVLFDPWIKRDPALPNPVIIVPGIMSTKLLKDNTVDNLIWPNFPSIALSITDDFLNVLKMDNEGLPVDSDIISGELLTGAASVDYWNGLTSLFNEDILFIFPYDWRLDINTSGLGLKNKIDQIKLETGAEEVDIIGHSMGGLLVKEYLKNYGGDSVNIFVDIASPHTGAPSAFKTLMYGDNIGISYIFGIFNLNSQKIKEISQNMPSVYQLLPSQKYFEGSGSNYYVFDGVNNSQRFTFNQTKDYMKSEGRNGSLIDRANEFHQEIDDLNPVDYGVETYNIVGCGTPTIGQFYLLEGGNHPIYNIKYINGDGTVPLKSAEAMQATQTYYVKEAKHAVMPSTSGVKELVGSILTREDLNISSYSNLATNSNGCQIPNGQIVSLHSPIELHVYDSSGNHTGPDENGDIENEIDGVVYEVIDDNKFAFLPSGVQYNVQGSATDVGTFDTRIQEIVDGEVVTTNIFADIPLTLTTQMNFDIGSSIPTQIYLDHDGDDVFESGQSVSTTTAGLLESTGKVVPGSVEIATNSSSRSSRVQLAIAKEMSTSTQETVLPAPILIEEVLGASIARSDPPEIVEESPVTISQSEKTEYENTAVVYKSFGQKVLSMFKVVWSWIKSRL